MTYTVSSGTLKSTVPYHTVYGVHEMEMVGNVIFSLSCCEGTVGKFGVHCGLWKNGNQKRLKRRQAETNALFFQLQKYIHYTESIAFIRIDRFTCRNWIISASKKYWLFSFDYVSLTFRCSIFLFTVFWQQQKRCVRGRVRFRSPQSEYWPIY